MKYSYRCILQVQLSYMGCDCQMILHTPDHMINFSDVCDWQNDERTRAMEHCRARGTCPPNQKSNINAQ